MGNKPSSKEKNKKGGNTPDNGKLAYKRQFSLENARDKQQTLLDFYTSSSYGTNNTNDDKKNDDKIREKINAAANMKFAAGVSVGADQEFYDTLNEKDQLTDKSKPRRKTNVVRPSELLDIQKLTTDLELEFKTAKETVNTLEKENGNSFKHEKPIQWGYCELTRKQLDEDQAAFATWTHDKEGYVHAWAVFDGHGGYEVALYAAQHFLKYVEKYHKTRENGVLEAEWPKLFKDIFVNFDKHIGTLNLRGGCTVVIVLLVKYRLIIANAGDARAIMSKWDGKAGQLSFDHTPMADYERVVKLVKTEQHHALITKYFRINDKHETLSDIQKLPVNEVKKAPLISRELEKSRLLATIGVARGFGDFNLTVFGFRNIPIKPFLSCEPWVNIVELKENEIGDTDTLIIACDGVYDVLHNQEIIDKVRWELYFDTSQIPRNLSQVRSMQSTKSKSKSKSNSSMKKSKSMQKSKSNQSKSSKQEEDIQYVEPKVGKESNDTLVSGNSSDNFEYPVKKIKDPSGKLQSVQIKPIQYKKLDKICNDLGRLAYKRGTLDDVSVFLIPLKQVFNCVH